MLRLCSGPGPVYLAFVYPTPMSHIAWYCDWLVTTPLIVLALALTAQLRRAHPAYDVTALIILAQVLTIFPGLLGHITHAQIGRYVWFSIGCVMMVLVWYLIWGPLMRMAQHAGGLLYTKYKLLGSYVILLWATYPIIWMLSPIGLGYMSEEATRIAFVVLPLICKPGFGFLDMYYVHQIMAYDQVDADAT